MRIDYPSWAQINALRQLWQAAFQDPDDYLESFFSMAFSPVRCRCVMADGMIAAMLHWLDMTCRGKRVAYLYAVATHSQYQGQGLCRALMEDTHRLLAAQGYVGAILVPENGGLAGMYGKMGYRHCSSMQQMFCEAAPEAVPLRAVDAGEYAQLRGALMPAGGVELGETALAFLESQAEFFAGDDFVLTAVREGPVLRGLELLGDAAAAPRILAALGCASGNFRTPGSGIPFAMYHSLDAATPAPVYFGLAFD